MVEESARDRIINDLRQALSSRDEVLEAYLFGSHAREQASAHSDIDVAVYVDSEAAEVKEAPFGYAADLTTHLIGCLGRNDVDVALLNSASPLLYHRVLRDGVRIVSRDLKATTTREGYALSRYCDFVPHLAKIERASRARIQRGDFGR